MENNNHFLRSLCTSLLHFIEIRNWVNIERNLMRNNKIFATFGYFFWNNQYFRFLFLHLWFLLIMDCVFHDLVIRVKKLFPLSF